MQLLAEWFGQQMEGVRQGAPESQKETSGLLKEASGLRNETSELRKEMSELLRCIEEMASVFRKNEESTRKYVRNALLIMGFSIIAVSLASMFIAIGIGTASFHRVLDQMWSQTDSRIADSAAQFKDQLDSYRKEDAAFLKGIDERNRTLIESGEKVARKAEEKADEAEN